MAVPVAVASAVRGYSAATAMDSPSTSRNGEARSAISAYSTAAMIAPTNQEKSSPPPSA